MRRRRWYSAMSLALAWALLSTFALSACEDPVEPPGPVDDMFMAAKAAHWIHGEMAYFYHMIPSNSGAVDETFYGSSGGSVHVTGSAYFDQITWERLLTFDFNNFQSGPLTITGTVVYDYYQFNNEYDWLAYTDNVGNLQLRVVTKARNEGDMDNDVQDVEDTITNLHIVNDGNGFHQIIGEITGQTGEEHNIWYNVYDWSRVY